MVKNKGFSRKLVFCEVSLESTKVVLLMLLKIWIMSLPNAEESVKNFVKRQFSSNCLLTTVIEFCETKVWPPNEQVLRREKPTEQRYLSR